MKITIKEIAKEAGVSITTVSQIINQKGERFSAETRQKVLQVIEKYHYKPDFFAQNMINRRSKTVGMVVPDVTDFFFSKVVQGVEKYMTSLGYMILLCSSQSDFAKEQEYIDELLHRSVDGIILATPHEQDYAAFKEKGKRKHTPILLIDRGKSIRDEGRMIVEEEQGVREGIAYLVENGHQVIGMLREKAGYYQLSERYDIYRKCLDHFHLPYSDHQVVEGELTLNGGYTAALQLLQQCPKVTALFCANDEMALGAFRAAAELGRKTPADLSIIGFDDLEIAQYCVPALTTIQQPIFDIGFQTAKFMVDAIENPNRKIPNKIFGTKLIVRDSVKRLTSF